MDPLSQVEARKPADSEKPEATRTGRKRKQPRKIIRTAASDRPAPARRVTQRQIAEMVGVHVSTVSLALRSHPSIPPATRERIHAVSQRLGYQPDPDLRALEAYRAAKAVRRSSEVLAYITNWTSRWGWRTQHAQDAFFRGAEARARELGHRIEHFWLGEPGLSNTRLSELLYARGIRGLIFAAQPHDRESRFDFSWKRFSAVRIESLPHAAGLNSVANDHRGIMRLAFERAIAPGYRRIGLLLDRDWDLASASAWSAGFIAQQQKVSPANRLPILSPAPNDHGPRQRPLKVQVQLWLRTHRPEVLIGSMNFLGTGEWEGWSRPESLPFIDLDLVGSDGRLAGVRHNNERVGELAVETTLRHLQQNQLGLPDLATATLVEGTWCDGASLRPLPTAVSTSASP